MQTFGGEGGDGIGEAEQGEGRQQKLEHDTCQNERGEVLVLSRRMQLSSGKRPSSLSGRSRGKLLGGRLDGGNQMLIRNKSGMNERYLSDTAHAQRLWGCSDKNSG